MLSSFYYINIIMDKTILLEFMKMVGAVETNRGAIILPKYTIEIINILDRDDVKVLRARKSSMTIEEKIAKAKENDRIWRLKNKERLREYRIKWKEQNE